MWVPIVVLLANVIVFAALFVFFRRLMSKQAEAGRKALDQLEAVRMAMREGEDAVAAVVRAKTRPSQSHSQVIVDLVLEVSWTHGKPFEARSAWKVDLTSVGKLAEGERVKVKLDKLDPSLVYPGESWAEPWPF